MAKLIEIPGQLGIDLNTGILVGKRFEDQTAAALENVAFALNKKGARVDDIVSLHACRTSDLPRDYRRYTEIGNKTHSNNLYYCFLRPYGKFLSTHLSHDNRNYRPARTFVEVDVLPSVARGEFLASGKLSPRIEIVARAIVKKDKTDYHKLIEAEGASSPEKYAGHGIVVDLGSKLYVETSSQLGREPPLSRENMQGGLIGQPQQALENIETILESVGGELEDVTDLKVYTIEDEAPDMFSLLPLIKQRLKSARRPLGLSSLDIVSFEEVVDIPKRVTHTDIPAWVSISAKATILKKDIRRREKEFSLFS